MKNIRYLMGASLIGIALLTTSYINDGKTAQIENSLKTTAVAEASGVGNSNSKALVVYFSYSENTNLPANVDASSRASIRPTENGVIGNTGVIARMIQKDVNADIVSLKTVEKYSASYDETVNKGRTEIESNARPALATHIDNINDYDIIFVGYPNWWSDMPMAMYTFFDEHDLSGKTIIPFNTSGGSGLSNTVNEIRQLEPNAQVLNGLTISGSQVNNAQNQVDNWLRGLGYLE